jgi:hypothetical protein
VKRNPKLGFVISLHLAVFAGGVYLPNTIAGLALGAASAVTLVPTLFYEISA